MGNDQSWILEVYRCSIRNPAQVIEAAVIALKLDLQLPVNKSLLLQGYQESQVVGLPVDIALGQPLQNGFLFH